MAILIIDLSSHQPPSAINYDLLADAVDGVILRAAYGVQIQGVPGPDPAFAKHYEEFHKRGVPVGAYHYICEWCTAKDQADLMKKTIAGKELKLGIWADVENEPGELPLTEKTVVEYMMLMGSADIYTGFYYWRDIMKLNPARYADRKLWLSAYTPSPLPYIPPAWKTQTLWQYTSHGSLPGYSGDLDISKYNGTDAQFDAWIGKVTVDYPELPLTAFSQKDPAWKDIKLGTSNVTIGAYGCLISDVAMVLKYYGKDTDPKRLNEALISVGGYLNNNLLIYSAVTKIYPDVVMTDFVTSGVSDKVDEVLASGKPAIVMVDYDPSDTDIDQHWVTIIGKTGGEYIILDPIDGARRTITSKYGKSIYKMVVYSKKEAQVVLFRVRVLIDNLLIRSGAGKTYPSIGYASGEYDVFEEKNDYYKIGDGKWISANPLYVQKVGDLTLEERVKKLEDWVIAHG